MCGIAGFLQLPGMSDGDMRGIAARMADSISHRGPDDAGTWADARAGVAFGHRRLAIIDLSSAGHQPMQSASGRWTIVYNGEIYNHLELRKLLEAEHRAPQWRGHSDTETLLAAVEGWGIEAALKACVGMFAFAMWDSLEQQLWLARDRVGEKPLYYGWQGTAFLFGSELKALRVHPSFNAGVDRGSLALLLRHNYIPAPYSIYTGICKLQPGTCLRIGIGERDPSPRSYWSLTEVAERGTNNPFAGTDEEALDSLSRCLSAAVRGQMIADVPLGVLLSGGIDSTTVAALMQANFSSRVRTFTIGFDDHAFDEAAQARAVAEHLGTQHTELRLAPNEALNMVGQMPEIYDEPFADSSQLPTYLVMRLARQHVKVALSGDAGDEFFGGYNRYFLGHRAWRWIGWMPLPLRKMCGAMLLAMPAAAVNRLLGAFGVMAGSALSGEKLHKLGTRLRSVGDFDDFYVSLVSEWSHADDVVVNGASPRNLLADRARWPKLSDGVSRMMAMDALTYLPDDILVKVDRAAMAASLETRTPYLDRDVMEFAWSLPLSMKLRGGKGKWLLRQLLYRHVPQKLVDRPKMGFGIPLDQWLRGPLRSWAESLLGEDRLAREGYFNPAAIRSVWQRHLAGTESAGYRLWSVLMFQQWLEKVV